MIAILIGGIANAQWVHTNLDSTKSLNNVVKNGNTIFAVTEYSLYRSTNLGYSWTNVLSITGWGAIQSICIKNSKIYVGEYYGPLHVSSDNGNTWTNITNVPSTNISAIAVTDSIIFVALGNYGIYRSNNNGATWVNFSSGLTSSYIYSLAVNGNNIYAGVNAGGAFKSTLNGTSWNAVNNGLTVGDVESFFFQDSTIYIATSYGIYKSTNNCSSWNKIYNYPALSVFLVDTNIFASTYDYGLFLSKDNGANWNDINEGFTNIFYNSATILIGDTLYTGLKNGIWKRPYSDLSAKDTIISSSNTPMGGTTSGGGIYTYCQSCTLKASRNIGYTFVAWTENGNIVSIDSIYTFVVKKNRNLVAHFFPQYFVTTIESPLNGGTSQGGGSFNVNELCTLKASPNPGYIFGNWSKDNNYIASYDSIYTFIVYNDENLIANFFPIEYIISTSSVSGGTTYGGGGFNINQTCSVKATPDIGYVFANWKENGNIVSIDSIYTFVVTANRNLVATFVPQFIVTTIGSPINGGTTQGGGLFNANQICTLKASFNLGYIFGNWTENGNIVSMDSVYTFVVTANRNMVANFSSTQSIVENISNQFSFYPNPATNSLTLNLGQLQKLQNATVSIYDIQGKQLLLQNLSHAQTQIDISSFAKGIYIVRVQTDKETLQSKFVKE